MFHRAAPRWRPRLTARRSGRKTQALNDFLVLTTGGRRRLLLRGAALQPGLGGGGRFNLGVAAAPHARRRRGRLAAPAPHRRSGLSPAAAADPPSAVQTRGLPRSRRLLRRARRGRAKVLPRFPADFFFFWHCPAASRGARRLRMGRRPADSDGSPALGSKRRKIIHDSRLTFVLACGLLALAYGVWGPSKAVLSAAGRHPAHARKSPGAIQEGAQRLVSTASTRPCAMVGRRDRHSGVACSASGSASAS